MRVLVVGAGIAGLATACALRKQQAVDVEVVERRDTPAAGGLGLNLPQAGLRALRDLGFGLVDSVLSQGCRYDRQTWYTSRGEEIVAVDAPEQDGLPGHCGLGRGVLARQLTEAACAAGARITAPRTVRSVREDGDAVEVTFSTGRSRWYDLVVAADGAWSTLRGYVDPAARPEWTGAGVWRVVLPREVDHTMLWQGTDGSKAGVIPISAESMYLLLVTSEPGNPRWEPDQRVPLLRQRLVGYEGLPARVRQDLSDDAEVSYSPLHEVLCTRWWRGRVVLVGDAAHAFVPHATLGAAMATEDACVLAAALAQWPIPEALERYEVQRLPRVRVVVEESREIMDAERRITPATFAADVEDLRRAIPEGAARLGRLLAQHP